MSPAPTTPADITELAETFRYFAEQRAGNYAPLYARLAAALAEDHTLLAVAAQARPGQSRPDLLLAAIHDVLHDHRNHPAARFYPNLTAHPDTRTDPAPAVLAFCHEYLHPITERVATRLVQTNEVRRCTYLTPALHAAARLAPQAPLALVEVGASAGLNLHFDRYNYRYTSPDNPTTTTLAGDPDAPVLDCDLRGPHRPPLAAAHPGVVWRAGIDLNPLDPTESADRQWLISLTWPDHLARAARLTAALDVAAAHPLRLVRGDAAEALPDLAADAPDTAQLVVYHTAVLAHMTIADRARFTDTLLTCSQTRPVLWIQAEPRTDADPRRLRLTHCADGQVITDHALGSYHPHGEWLTWTADDLLPAAHQDSSTQPAAS